MNIGFYVGRLIYTSHFGALIDCFREKGARITLLCDYRQKPKDCGYKAYQYPYLKSIQNVFEKEEVLNFQTAEEFVDIIIENQLQAVFFFPLDSIAKETKALLAQKAADVLFIRLQIGLEMMSCTDLPSTDIAFIFCENWKTWWKKWLMLFDLIPEKDKDYIFEQIDTKAVASGLPQFDSIVNFDRHSICEKYGLPEDKKIILYLPFPWRVPFSIWSHIIYKPQNKITKLAKLLLHGLIDKIPDIWHSQAADDLQVAQAIRKFADRNNAFLLVKGRLKNKIPSYLSKIADKVVNDETYYPHTTIELMSIADLSLNFYSEANKESVMCGTPCVCLGPTKPEDWTCYAKRFAIEEFSPRSGSFYNFDGVVFNESVDDFAKNFPSKTFDDYRMNIENKDKFIKKYLGYSDKKSSERIYNHLSNRLSSQATSRETTCI
ncbi:MAG: hypothetical protein JW912_02590 [Sedimentisphaerales bacterium]|nr:hypothetical protein [Sedimentisphaerales bacterium]